MAVLPDAERGVVAMLRAANLNVHVYIDEDDDGTNYVEALMVRNDRHLLPQSKTVLPQQDHPAEPWDEGRIAAGALSGLAQKLMHSPLGGAEVQQLSRGA